MEAGLLKHVVLLCTHLSLHHVETVLLKHFHICSHFCSNLRSSSALAFALSFPGSVSTAAMSSGGFSSSQQAWGRGSSSQSDWKPAWKKHDDWKDYLGDDTHGWKKPEAITGKLLAYADTSGEVHGGGSTAEAVPEHKDLHDLKSSWQADEKDL